MKVSDIMTSAVVTARPGDTITQVARQMSEIDSGVIPICEGSRLIGLITDRDIVIRVIGEKRDSEIAVSEVMTTKVETCRPDDTVKAAVAKMADLQIRRLVVVDDTGRLAGILSLGDVARERSAREVGHTLEEISED